MNTLNFLILLSLINQSFASVGITIENNGYSGVVVAFAPNVTEKDGYPLIENIKELFINASKSLHKATKSKLYFKEITILIPETWPSKPEYSSATFETFNQAAIRIDHANSKDENNPYTVQHMGCGHRGLYIQLTLDYIKNLKTTSRELFGDPGKTLVHEWAHYRYGIFDEYGYPKSKQFPIFYWDPDNKTYIPNYCAEKKINGRYWDDDNDAPCQYTDGIPDENCLFLGDNNTNNDVQTSLSSYFYLPNVTSFCDSTNHNSHAPNKQNVLCKYKSAWEIINQNIDLSNIVPTQTIEPVTFKIVQQPDPSYILVLDKSSSMRGYRLEMLKTTVTQWLKYEIKNGWSIGIVSFSDTSYSDLKMVTVTSEADRDLLIDKIPKVAGGWTCIGCGLKTAIEMMKKHRGLGGTIILLSDGEENREPKILDVLDELKASNIRVISIVFTQDASQQMELIANVTGGKTFFVSPQSGIEGMSSAFFESVAYQSTDIDTTVKVYEMRYNNTKDEIVNGSFIIDKTIGEHIMVNFGHNKENDITNVKIFDSDGFVVQISHDGVVGPNKLVTGWASVSKNTKLYRFDLRNLQPKRYNYSITRNNKIPDQDILISVSSQSLNRKPIVTKCWIEELGTDPRKQLFIFADVKQGSYPVIDSTVVAQVERPDGTSVDIDLWDNGAGADVVADDGIYTRYFTQLVNVTGRYTVKANVVGNDRSSIRQNGFLASRSIPIINKYMKNTLETKDVPTGDFERISYGGSFKINEVDMTDTIPPVRVVDLRIVDVTPETVTIQWTASGDDFDTGTVSQYEILYSNYFEIFEDVNTTVLDTSDLIPLKSGLVQTYIPKIPTLSSDTSTFIALRATDEVFNWSEISNIISVKLVKMIASDPETVEKKYDYGLITGFVVGFIAIIAVIAGLVLWCSRKQAREKRAL